MRFDPDDFDRQTPSCPVGTFAPIMLPAAALGVFGNSDIKRIVDAAEDVAVLHENKFSAIILEAGGVEPPSEMPCYSKTTCLSRSVGFAGRTQSGQDALPASPMISPAHYGPKRASQPTV